MQQKESTHKPDQEQALQDLWLKECADFEKLSYTQKMTLRERLRAIFQAKKMNSSRFQEKTELSPTIFTKIKSDKYSRYKPSLDSIIAICIGLDLPYLCSMQLLRAGNYCLDDSEPCHQIYMFILRNNQHFDIDGANRFLIQNHSKPISGKNMY